jgi:hypothetical protein
LIGEPTSGELAIAGESLNDLIVLLEDDDSDSLFRIGLGLDVVAELFVIPFFEAGFE